MKAIETALSLTQAYKLGIERLEKILHIIKRIYPQELNVLD